MARRTREPHDPNFRWTDLASQLHGARDKTVTQVLRLRRSPHHAHISMPGGLLVSICWSGIPSKPYHLWVTRERKSETGFAPDVAGVQWEGDSEWMGADIAKHTLPEVLEKLAGVTPEEAKQATQRLHNQLGPPKQGHLF